MKAVNVLAPHNPTVRGQWTSASNAEADELCAGRHLASRDLPDNQPASVSQVGDRGDRIHAFLHWKRIGEPAYLRNENCPILADAAERDLAERCWDLEQEEKRLWLESIGGRAEIECHSEKRLWLNVPIGLKHSGQADAIYICGPFCLVIDTKSGFLEVAPPNENMQLRDLAVLADFHYGPVLPQVSVQVVRPFGKRQPPCVYQAEDLTRAHRDLLGRVARSNDPSSPRTPNEISCRYCRAKGTSRCFESQQAVVLLSQTAQELIARPTAEFLDACKLVMGIAKQAQQNAKALLATDPDAIPGYVLEPNKPMRPIIDAQVAWNRAQTHGMNIEEFMRCVKVGKGELEAELKAKHRKLTNRERIPYAEWKLIEDSLYSGILGTTPKEPTLKRLAAGRDARNEDGTPRTPEDGSNPSASTSVHGTV